MDHMYQHGTCTLKSTVGAKILVRTTANCTTCLLSMLGLVFAIGDPGIRRAAINSDFVRTVGFSNTRTDIMKNIEIFGFPRLVLSAKYVLFFNIHCETHADVLQQM